MIKHRSTSLVSSYLFYIFTSKELLNIAGLTDSIKFKYLHLTKTRFDMKSVHIFIVIAIISIIPAFLAAGVSTHVNALIVVDVQNCFITGNLALSNRSAHQDGAEVVPIINRLIETIPFDVIVYTYDWHPRNHISFFDNLESRRRYLQGDQNRKINMEDEVTYTGPKVITNQILWASHCIQDTQDAQLHKDLRVVQSDNKVIHLRKGTDPDVDSYSAFADNINNQKTELDQKLRERNVTRIFVSGLATDYCVSATALDAFNLNYTTYLIKDASRGISLDTIDSKLTSLKQLGVGIIQADQVNRLVSSSNNKCLSFLLTIFINISVLLLN